MKPLDYLRAPFMVAAMLASATLSHPAVRWVPGAEATAARLDLWLGSWWP